MFCRAVVPFKNHLQKKFLKKRYAACSYVELYVYVCVCVCV